MPDAMYWRNPMRNYDFVRDEWLTSMVQPHGWTEFVRIRRLADEAFEVRDGEAFVRIEEVVEAFELAASWTKAAAAR